MNFSKRYTFFFFLLGITGFVTANTTTLPATLTIDGHQFQTEGKQVTLRIQIKNIGHEAAQNVSVEFTLPMGVTPIGTDYVTIPTIAPNQTKTATFKFGNPNKACTVRCLVTEGNTRRETMGSFKFQLPTNRSAANTELIWMSPDPDMVGTKIVADKDVYDIKLKAISNSKLKAQNFTVYINNTSQDGSKFEEGSLVSASSTSPRKRHTYSGKLKLQKGVNRIIVEVKNEDGTTQTIPIEINYNPKRSNLHVLAIGPTHKDLQFTSKDASDFANAFRNQEDRIFKKVFVHTLTDAQTTNKASIQRALYDLQNNYENDVEEAIKDNDVVMVFISSHGKKYGRDFKILSSAYEFRYPQLETVDYEADILRILDNIDCKKMVFIDACNSGAAKDWGRKSITDEEMSKALHTLINAKAGLSTITSCQKNELSYEHQRWQNGAFTEAILAAFANQRFVRNGKIYVPDADGNRIITLGELKNYLVAYVPHLVKTQKPDAITSQKPHVAASELDMDIPVYALDSYVHQEYTTTESQVPAGQLVSSKQIINYSNPTYSNPPVNANPAFSDRDNDGISDLKDNCPDESGSMENNGCPEAAKPAAGPASGIFTDDRDRFTYAWKRMKDGKKWMTQNLNIATAGDSWFHGQKGKKGKNKRPELGRLYTWEAARKACPKGWRLPTKAEFQNLINHYGGAKAGYEALTVGGGSGFDAQFSGLRQSNGNYCCIGDYGNYWTKDGEVASGYYFDFNQLNSEVEVETYDKNTGLSCRCIAE
ncbi:MAG: FISUMP domain-containing protein [Bacteroidota bacterium]